MLDWVRKRLQKPPDLEMPPDEGNGFPRRFSLAQGALTVTVHEHEIVRHGDSFPCWTYMTEGLRAVGQKEMLLTVAQEAGEGAGSFPQEELEFFAIALRLAREGKQVDTGGYTHFGTTPFFEHPALLYVEATPAKDIPASPAPLSETLRLLLLKEGELEAVKQWGPTRVLSRFGHAARYYPFPEWNERRRPELPLAPELKSSILAQMARLRAPGTSVYREEEGVVLLKVTPKAAQGIRTTLSGLPEPMPVALLTDWEATASGCLVWIAGHKEAEAITPGNTRAARLSGNFMLINPVTADAGDDVHLIEDGFVLQLTPSTYTKILLSLRDKTPMTLPAGKSGYRFSLWYTA